MKTEKEQMGQHVVKYDSEGRFNYNCRGMAFFAGPAPGPESCRRCNQPLVRQTAIEAAKRDLAEKVLDAVWLTVEDPKCCGILDELNKVFADSGIELTTTQQQEGEGND